MNINLLGIPPTEQDFERELEKSELAVSTDEKQYNRRLYQWSLFVVSVAGVCWYTWPWLWFVLVLISVVLIAFGARFLFDDRTHFHVNKHDYKNIDSALIDDVIKACELDPRVDEYRLKVVAQGRLLTNLEGKEFQRWHQEGFRRNQAILRVRQNVPPVRGSRQGR